MHKAKHQLHIRHANIYLNKYNWTTAHLRGSWICSSITLRICCGEIWTTLLGLLHAAVEVLSLAKNPW